MSPSVRIDRLGAKEIGRRVKEVRESNDLSQEELSDKMGMSQQMLSKIERGAAILPAHFVPILCKITDTTPNTFFHHYQSLTDPSATLDTDAVSIALNIQKIPLNLRGPIISIIDELSARQSNKSSA